MNTPTLSAQRVDALDVDALPKGQITRLLVTIARDGLGLPIALPIIAARGTRPGPVFGVTAAVHGNELNGIPVIHQLFEKVEPRKLRGTLIGVPVVNIPGFRQEQRVFNDGVDLNHIMPGDPQGNTSQIFAYRFVQRVLRSFDYLVDLHTASFGRINSLYVRADMTNEQTARMAYLQRPQIILHNPPSDRTVRGAAMELGVRAITLEIGDPHRFQREMIRRSLVGLRAIIAEVGMLAKRSIALGPAPVLCSSSDWMYTDIGGLLEVFPKVTDVVEEGETIARLYNIFGDLEREYTAPRRGVVIGKSVNPVAQTGARILHLGALSTADEALKFHPRTPPNPGGAA